MSWDYRYSEAEIGEKFESLVEAYATAFAVNKVHALHKGFNESGILDELSSQMTFGIKTHILGKESGTLDFRYPEGPWQWLKYRWFKTRWVPKWFRYRFPVKMKTVSWELKMLFPQWRIPRQVGTYITFGASGPDVHCGPKETFQASHGFVPHLSTDEMANLEFDLRTTMYPAEGQSQKFEQIMLKLKDRIGPECFRKEKGPWSL